MINYEISHSKYYQQLCTPDTLDSTNIIHPCQKAHNLSVINKRKVLSLVFSFYISCYHYLKGQSQQYLERDNMGKMPYTSRCHKLVHGYKLHPCTLTSPYLITSHQGFGHGLIAPNFWAGSSERATTRLFHISYQSVAFMMT